MPDSDSTDFSRLLEAARGGSADALGRLLDAFRPYLRLVASLRMPDELRGPVGESDLAAETILLAVKHFDGFRGETEASLRSWLRRILINQMADARKRRPPGRSVPLAGSDSDSGMLPAALADTDTPSDQAMEAEEKTRLQLALARLPQHYRDVIALRQGPPVLTFPEMGARLGVSADAARQLWGRAVKELTRHVRHAHEPR
jgi:RNA polymerase sigma-70 factor (ECF subfamily)